MDDFKGKLLYFGRSLSLFQRRERVLCGLLNSAGKASCGKTRLLWLPRIVFTGWPRIALSMIANAQNGYAALPETLHIRRYLPRQIRTSSDMARLACRFGAKIASPKSVGFGSLRRFAARPAVPGG